MHGASAQQGVVRLQEQDLRGQPEDDDGRGHVRRPPEERVPGPPDGLDRGRGLGLYPARLHPSNVPCSHPRALAGCRHRAIRQ